MLSNDVTNNVRVQNLTPYQYNSIRQRKDSKGKGKFKTPTPNFSLRPTSIESVVKRTTKRRDDVSKSAGYTSQSRTLAVDQKTSDNNLMGGIPHKSEQHLPVDSQRKCINQRLSPSPEKAFVVKEDGTLKTCTFFLPVPVSVDQQRDVTVPKETDRRKNKTCYSCLSDSNMMEITETENCRFESFDTLTHPIIKFQHPVIGMPEKVWKVSIPVAKYNRLKGDGAAFLSQTGKSTRPNILKSNDLRFSDAMASINNIHDIGEYRKVVGARKYKCTTRPPSPPTLSKSELRIWDNQDNKSEIKQGSKKTKTACRRSKSSHDVGRKNKPNIIGKIDEPKTNGRSRRKVVSPKVLQSMSLYDYRTVVLPYNTS